MSPHRAAARIELGTVVLCGGQSRRMGRAKAWLPFEGQTLLERAVSRVRSVACRVVVVAAAEQRLPALPDEIEIARDPVADRGPLQGVAVGLEALAARVELAFVAATDAPFLHGAFILRLAQLCSGQQAAVPQVDGRLHPLAAVYRTALHAQATALLAAGERRLGRLLEVAGARRLDAALLLADPALRAADPQLRALRNLNDEAAYRAATQSSPIAGLER